jgi:hypothetical protein
MLAGLAMRAVLARPGSGPWDRGKLLCTSLLVGLSIISFASIDELTQPLVGRTCDVADWLADCAGTAVSIVAAVFVHWARHMLSDVNPEYVAG